MKRTLVAAAVVALAAFGGYAGYWHYLAARIPPALAAWAEEQRARGYTVGFGAVEVSGFPGRMHIRVADPSLGEPDAANAWLWRADAVESVAGPFSYEEVRYKVPDGGRLVLQPARADGPLTATAGFASGALRLDRRGEPVWGELTVAALRVALPAGEGVVAAARARLEARHRPASGPDKRDGGLGFSWTLDDVALPQTIAGPLGPHIARLGIDAEIRGTGPALAEQASPRETVIAWRDGEGRLVVRAFTLDWGPLKLSSSGEIGLDQEMRPAGNLDTLIQGYRETAQVLVRAGLVEMRDAATAVVALDLMSKEADGGARVVELPLTARDGALSVGPFRLTNLPPLTLPD